MKQLFTVLFIVLLAACGQKPAVIKSNKQQDSVKVEQVVAPVVDTPATEAVADPDNEFETFYLVQVASGRNFDSLKAISSNAVAILGSKFNMLDRVYKQGKGVIVPENSEDEIYAGTYYPRRPFEDQNFVSIEMTNGFISGEADTLEMLSIAGIYKLKSQADSVSNLLKDKISTVKTIVQKMYLGCMH